MPPGEHHKTIAPSYNQPPTELTKPFSLDELATGISLFKPGKAAGLDDLLTEMLQHLGNKAKYIGSWTCSTNVHAQSTNVHAQSTNVHAQSISHLSGGKQR